MRSIYKYNFWSGKFLTDLSPKYSTMLKISKIIAVSFLITISAAHGLKSDSLTTIPATEDTEEFDSKSAQLFTASELNPIALVDKTTFGSESDTNPDEADIKKSDSPLSILSSIPVKSAVPLSKPTFRPVNRRLPGKEKKFHDFPIARDVEIPYGNDMLIASGENSDFPVPLPRGNTKMHRHPCHHHGQEDSDSDDDEGHITGKKIVMKKRKDGHRFHGKKRQDIVKKKSKQLRYQNEEKKQNNKSFMGTVRKFLDKYF